MSFSALLSLLSVASCVLAAVGPVADLHIVNRNISPDGFTRSAVLAGSTSTSGTFPGPLITANKGDIFKLNVIDELTDTSMLRSTTIHWHGFFQAKSAWADGVDGVTQCPIAPGHSFLYTFDTTDQAGTWWYHSHYEAQYCDGLRGAMVVYDSNDPHRASYDVDNESTIITLADWYHSSSRGEVEPDPDSTLINGLGRYKDGPKSPLAVISVTQGTRYRFRLISLSCYPHYDFSIDKHAMTIIEVDGVPTNPLTVGSLRIFAGQRYSFILNANQTIGNYWVRANPHVGRNGFNGGINSAILRYVGAPNSEPSSSQTTGTVLKESNLRPLIPAPVPGLPQPGGVDLALNIDIERSSNKWAINGASFVRPTVPVLLQLLSGAKTAQELFPKGAVHVLPPNATVEVKVHGGTHGPHPFHLHGHSFWVVKSADGANYNYVNPILRDVVNTGSGGDDVTIRFKTDNSGPWIFHCHIDWHLVGGLAMVFAENVTDIAMSAPPAAWDQLCPIFDALPEDEM